MLWATAHIGICLPLRCSSTLEPIRPMCLFFITINAAIYVANFPTADIGVHYSYLLDHPRGCRPLGDCVAQWTDDQSQPHSHPPPFWPTHDHSRPATRPATRPASPQGLPRLAPPRFVPLTRPAQLATPAYLGRPGDVSVATIDGLVYTVAIFRFFALLFSFFFRAVANAISMYLMVFQTRKKTKKQSKKAKNCCVARRLARVLCIGESPESTESSASPGNRQLLPLCLYGWESSKERSSREFPVILRDQREKHDLNLRGAA